MSFDSFDTSENEKDFSLTRYLEHLGFFQERDSDKRDNFIMEYIDPFAEVTYTVDLTIHYNLFYTYFSLPYMEILFKRKSESHLRFKGLAPLNFDDAMTIFNAVLPTKEYLDAKGIGEGKI